MTDHEDHPMDPAGCFLFAARFAGCSALLWILMGLGILIAALLSLLL